MDLPSRKGEIQIGASLVTDLSCCFIAMFYLIGVEHSVQSISKDGVETTDHTAFRVCLEESIELYKPVIVAEEYSNDALGAAGLLKRTSQDFFTKKIASAAGVTHMLCDPDIKTKAEMGYQEKHGWAHHLDALWERIPYSDRALLSSVLEIAKDFPLRENYWLRELRDFRQEDVVFICGDSHVETFAERLGKEKISYKIVKRRIGMTPELIKESDKEMEYLKSNRNHVEEMYQKILALYGGIIPPLRYL
jgi:hypothetical protein